MRGCPFSCFDHFLGESCVFHFKSAQDIQHSGNGFCALAFAAQASAAGIDSLSNKDTTSGLKEALTRGAELAVGQLGKTDGFMGNPKVRIPLPESARAAEK